MIDEKKLFDELEFQIKNCEDFGHSDIYIDVDIAKEIYELLKQPKVSEQIPVEERLPDKPGSYRVACLYADKWYRVKDDLFYSDKTWAYDNIHRERKVISWKEIEEPFKGETE